MLLLNLNSDCIGVLPCLRGRWHHTRTARSDIMRACKTLPMACGWLEEE